MRIQLAEGMFSEQIPLSQLSAQDIDTNYIFIPAGYMNNQQDIYVRADFFDDLPDNEYDAIMFDLMQYQPSAMEENGDTSLAFIGKWLSNMKANKDQRKELKAQKKEAKIAKKEAKASRIEAAGQAKLIKAQAKADAAAAGMPTGLDKITGAVSGLFPGGGEVDFSVTDQPPKKPFPTALVVGGIAAVGLIIYAVTRPKPQRR